MGLGKVFQTCGKVFQTCPHNQLLDLFSNTRTAKLAAKRGLPSNFRAISCLYQRRRVSGVASVSTSFRRLPAKRVSRARRGVPVGVSQVQPPPPN